MVLTLVAFFIGGDLVSSKSFSSWMLVSAHVCKIMCQCLYLFEAVQTHL